MPGHDHRRACRTACLPAGFRLQRHYRLPGDGPARPPHPGLEQPGRANVLRIGGKKAAAITLVGDSLKGLIPLLVAHALGLGTAGLAATGLAAFLGHLYPVFFGFQGGKGVATALGVQFGLYWPLGLGVAVIWLFMAKVIRISSLSALVSMGVAPFLLWWLWDDPWLIGMQVIISLILFWRHRSNIRNLLTGAEGRIGADRPSQES